MNNWDIELRSSGTNLWDIDLLFKYIKRKISAKIKSKSTTSIETRSKKTVNIRIRDTEG